MCTFYFRRACFSCCLVISFLHWCMHLGDFFLFQIQLHRVHSPHFSATPKKSPQYFLLLQFFKWFSFNQWRGILFFSSTIFLFDQRNFISMKLYNHVILMARLHFDLSFGITFIGCFHIYTKSQIMMKMLGIFFCILSISSNLS